MLTWSFGCTLEPASAAITSFAFVFVEVPEPVWKTSIGNCASCLPAAISPAPLAMLAARRLSSRPSSPLTSAAAPFTRASQRTTDTGTRSPEIGKFSTALVVSAPPSCFSGIGSPWFYLGPPLWAHQWGPPARGTLPAERGQLPGEPHWVVIGDQKARALQHS